MKLGREVSRHNELDNWRNTHRFESVMATKWLLLTISETEPGLWDRLLIEEYNKLGITESITGCGREAKEKARRFWRRRAFSILSCLEAG